MATKNEVRGLLAEERQAREQMARSLLKDTRACKDDSGLSGGNHLSNATCLTQGFFKRGE